MTRGEKMARWAAEQVKCPYVFATAGEKCTPSNRRAKARKRPQYASQIEKYCPVLSGKKTACAGCKWQGKKAYDCRGLVYRAAKEAGLTISSIGSSSQWRGDYWQEKGLIADMPRDKPCVIFHQSEGDPDVMSHVGMYLGDGMEVDARGHEDGVVHKGIDAYPWTHYGILRGADEECLSPDPERPMLRKGSQGVDVRSAQEILSANGYSVGGSGPDGIFGTATKAAVRAFQADHGLTPDGVIGPLTWAALDQAAGVSAARYTVTITDVSAGDATALLEAWGSRATATEETEGK